MTHLWRFIEADPFFYGWVGGLVGFCIGAQVERMAMRAKAWSQDGEAE